MSIYQSPSIKQRQSDHGDDVAGEAVSGSSTAQQTTERQAQGAQGARDPRRNGIDGGQATHPPGPAGPARFQAMSQDMLRFSGILLTQLAQQSLRHVQSRVIPSLAATVNALRNLTLEDQAQGSALYVSPPLSWSCSLCLALYAVPFFKMLQTFQAAESIPGHVTHPCLLTLQKPFTPRLVTSQHKNISLPWHPGAVLSHWLHDDVRQNRLRILLFQRLVSSKDEVRFTAAGAGSTAQ